MEALVQWARIFNVNKAANHLIPEENEKCLNCCGRGGTGPSSCDYAWLSGVDEEMYWGNTSIIYVD